MATQTHVEKNPQAAIERAKKRAENQLEQTSQWLQMLIDAAEDYAIFSISKEGRVSSWSRGAQKLFGYEADEIVGREFATIFTPEDREQKAPEEEIDHAQKEGYCPDVRWHVRKDGQRIFVSGSVRPFWEKNGNLLGCLKVAHDITEQRRKEQELRDSEERHRMLVDNMTDFALFAFDLTGRITHWNPGAEHLLGYAEWEMLGQSVDGLYTAEDQKAGVPAREREIALREETHTDELWFVRKDGTRMFVTESIRRMEDEHGRLRGFLKVARDITKKQQLENELRQARDHLEALVSERTKRLKETIGELEAFTYSVSHDLRAPLRTMQGFAEILRAEHSAGLGAEGTDLLERIIEGSKRADELIRDVLMLSRVAREPPHLEPVDVEKVLSVLLEQTPEFQPPHADVALVRPMPKVLGHGALLSQCFSNLLWNAIKFVMPGVKPRVNIWSEALDSKVRIWVKDNGIGIPKGQEQRIFGLFERLHHQESYPGTGIGLAIVRKAVERMNGRVGVESEPGAGSRFWVELGAARG